MSLQTIEIEAFSGPTSVLIGGGNQPTIVYINQGPKGADGSGSLIWGNIIGTLSNQNDLQTALNLKANLASPTFTGTVSGITKSMVGLSNVDNTSDANKPVSTAQQTALNLKANLASPTFTGIVTAPRIDGKCAGLELFCKAGAAIGAGQVVYVTGAAGSNIIVGLAKADDEATSSKTIGVSESALAINATGYVITEGLMTVSITVASTVNEGDPIWLSGTTAGGMVFGAANEPNYPYHAVYLGVVTKKTGLTTVSEIYVKVQNGLELRELSDVQIITPVNKQALVHDGSKWVNRALVSTDVAGLTIADGQTINAGSSITTNATNGSIQTGEYAPIFTGSSGHIGTGNAGWIQTGENGYIQTAAGASIQTSVNGGIYTSTNGSITTSVNAYMEIGASITTFAGGYIDTATNGYITTAANAPISTANGGFLITGTGNLTGPNTSGTIALIDPSSGTQTFSGAQIFSTRPTSSAAGTPEPMSLITRTDLETQLMSNDFVYVVDDFFGGGGPSAGIAAPGPLPWVLTTLIGTTAFRYGANTALSLPCPGGASIQTGTNNRDCGAVSFASNFGGGGAITQSDFNSSTILKWRFYVQSAMGLRIGLGGNPVAPTFQSTRFIGLTGWSPATAWPSSTAILLGDYYRPTTPNGRRYYASVAGTTGSTEPVWPTGAASTVVDGGVTWTEDGRDGSANFQYCTRDGTALTGTQTDSGIPYAVGWHTFTLRYLGSGNWGMSVDGASEATLNISVASITILMQAQAYTTGQKHLLFDYFKFFQRVR